MSGNVADCIGIIGASGTGKGLYAFAKLAPLADRLRLVWSPLEATDRYGHKLHAPVARTIPSFVAAIKSGRRAVVYLPPDNPKQLAKDFDYFCRIVWHSPRAVALVEELSRVTSASWAPRPWRDLSTAGRHQGLTVIATAQRPAQIDKDFLGNCTEVRAYRVNYSEDARALASIMRARPELFLELPDRHYLQRWIRERRWVFGIQPLPGGREVALQAGEGPAPDRVLADREPAPKVKKNRPKRAKTP